MPIDEQLEKEDVDMLSMMIYVKDRFSISGSAYHEMVSLQADAKALRT